MKCDLCPNGCAVDRALTVGLCGESDKMRIAKYYLHPYEEPILCGKNGAGAIFFCGCSLKCAFCQNYELSRSARGKIVSPEALADIMRELEAEGAANIDLVSPTHFAPYVIKALGIYRPKIPVVYNTHGYESVETLEKIDPFIDIYLPDVKFFSPARAKRYCGKADYFDRASKALEFMLKRKKTVVENGTMKSGVIVRHLVLPQNLDETSRILDFLRPITGDAYLSLMAQYTPFGDIDDLPELKRRLTRREYDSAVRKVQALGFERVFIQEFSSADESFIPAWDW